jgi:hypothetical protein
LRRARHGRRLGPRRRRRFHGCTRGRRWSLRLAIRINTLRTASP